MKVLRVEFIESNTLVSTSHALSFNGWGVHDNYLNRWQLSLIVDLSTFLHWQHWWRPVSKSWSNQLMRGLTDWLLSVSKRINVSGVVVVVVVTVWFLTECKTSVGKHELRHVSIHWTNTLNTTNETKIQRSK